MSVNINTTSNEVSVNSSTNNVTVVDNSTNPLTNVNITPKTTNTITVSTLEFSKAFMFANMQVTNATI